MVWVMKLTNLNENNTVFIVLSFEGPDLYSLAGGLGVRVTNLTRGLALKGFPVHLFFIGDPKKDGEERIEDRLYLHRWCQWISEYYPRGVYEGEYEKIKDYNNSIPQYIIENIAKPAIRHGKFVAVLGEEWHTSEVMSRLSDQLYANGIRDRVLMFWNANNTFCFDKIDWARLSFTSRITTVSRYMKHIMQEMGLNPTVIPNGIPQSLLNPVDEKQCTNLTNKIKANSILAKVARWDPDKRWDTAIDAVIRLKADGNKVLLIARGGIESYGDQLMYKARSAGLDIEDVYSEQDTLDDNLNAIGEAANADIINIKFHCPQELLRLIYRASDAVLANSSHEPFGLVGLETMAAGGIAITGGTGEDYATSYYNSIVLETADAKEIEESIFY
jgi:glycosyltransferase involved in cell wall biosynthesis